MCEDGMEQISPGQPTAFGIGVINSEGIAVDKDGFVYGAGWAGTVYRVDPQGKVEQIAQLPAGSVPNGITLDRNNDLVICDVGHSAVLRMTQSGKTSVIADRAVYPGMTTPNFATFDADGNLYVSNTLDITLSQVMAARPDMQSQTPTGSVLRIRRNGQVELVAANIHWANGLAIDPDEEAVFVLETNRNDCLRIPIRADGTHGRPEIYSNGFPACPDGMAFATDGSLIVTLPGTPKPSSAPPSEPLLDFANKIIRIRSDGEWEMMIDDPLGKVLVHPTNCAFGGPRMTDLYFANLHADHFTHMTSPLAGHPLYHQR
jgi:gluconolactonase